MTMRRCHVPAPSIAGIAFAMVYIPWLLTISGVSGIQQTPPPPFAPQSASWVAEAEQLVAASTQRMVLSGLALFAGFIWCAVCISVLLLPPPLPLLLLTH